MITDQDLVSAIKRVLDGRIVEIVNEEAKKAGLEVERRIKSEVADIATRVLYRYTIERHGAELVIRVELPQKT